MKQRLAHRADAVRLARGRPSGGARGITGYLENGGLLENAQAMVGHTSARTMKLYDRRGEQVSLDEVERITL